jgi:hypothetical protein
MLIFLAIFHTFLDFFLHFCFNEKYVIQRAAKNDQNRHRKMGAYLKLDQ